MPSGSGCNRLKRGHSPRRRYRCATPMPSRSGPTPGRILTGGPSAERFRPVDAREPRRTRACGPRRRGPAQADQGGQTRVGGPRQADQRRRTRTKAVRTGTGGQGPRPPTQTAATGHDVRSTRMRPVVAKTGTVWSSARQELRQLGGPRRARPAWWRGERCRRILIPRWS